MLRIIDFGCNQHNRRQFTLAGDAAEIIGDVLYNLPTNDGCYSFICEYGHTHQINFTVQVDNLYRLSTMVSRNLRRAGRGKPGKIHTPQSDPRNLMEG
jgi:hypothetical protein